MKHMRLQSLAADSVRDTIGEWLSAWPRSGVFALLPESEKDSLPILQAACRERSVPLVGALFPALVTGEGFVNKGGWLLHLGAMPATFLLADINEGKPDAATRLANAVEQAY
jgi:hypothetical protein